MKYRPVICLSLLLSAIVIATPSLAKTISLNDSNWDAMIATAEPGDTLILEPSKYPYTSKLIRGLHGTAQAPITFKAETPMGVTVDASSEKYKNVALHIRESSHLIIEGLSIKNGGCIDGRTDYSGSPRKILKEGVIVQDSNNITLQGNLFDNIATRGILSFDTDQLSVRNNLFIDVGDDTAASGLDLNRNTTHWQVSGNLFATNVDGITKGGSGTGGLIENNLILFNRHEDGIDIKSHLPAGGETPTSVVRRNIIYADQSAYTGLTLQDSAQQLELTENVIYGSGSDAALRIRGRCDPYSQIDTGCQAAVTGLHIHHNWLLNRGSKTTPGLAISETADSRKTPINYLNISDNSLLGYTTSVHSLFTSAPETIHLADNRLYSTDTIIDTQHNHHLASNSLDNHSQADALMLAGWEQDIVTTLVNDYSFPPQLMRKALNKASIPWPFVRQCQASDNHLVLTANDAGLASGLPDGLLPVGTDTDALSGNMLLSVALKSGQLASTAGKIGFRTLFTNPGTYQLYARLKCTQDCAQGDSLYVPNDLNSALDNGDDYQVSEPGVTPNWQWFNLGSYTPQTGWYNNLTLGLRDNFLLIDALVLHKSTGLESTPATLDQLVQQEISNRATPNACQ